MYINDINLKDFRNFRNSYVEFEKKRNIFFGENGQGKTNLTEALLLISSNRSFRKSKRTEYVNYNSKESILTANIDKEKIKIVINRDEKKIFLNEKRVYKKIKILDTFFINSDSLFYFKNFLNFRIKLIDKLCYNVYGLEFLQNYKKYINAVKNFKNEPANKIWLKIFKKYQEIINNYRADFFRKIREYYSETKERLELCDCVINFKGEGKKELNILRKDKKDLSLGELKLVLFTMYFSTIKTKNKDDSLLIIDDFNSEWDIKRQKKVKELINSLDIQSFIMETQLTDETNFIIAKGEIKLNGRRN